METPIHPTMGSSMTPAPRSNIGTIVATAVITAVVVGIVTYMVAKPSTPAVVTTTTPTASVVALVSSTPTNTPTPSPASTSTPTQTPGSLLTKTYTNSSGGFSFRYLPSTKIQSGDSGNQGSFLKTGQGTNSSVPVIVTATANTNAWLTVASSETIQNEADCRDYQKNAVAPLSGTKTIDGRTWFYGTNVGAAAGTAYRNYIYHILHNNVCYEVLLNTTTLNSASDTVLRSALDQMLATFTFTR